MSLGEESNLQKATSADMDSMATLQRIAEALGEVDQDDLSEAGLLVVGPSAAVNSGTHLSSRNPLASKFQSSTPFWGLQPRRGSTVKRSGRMLERTANCTGIVAVSCSAAFRGDL